jgi:archaellum biogenesis protein FlaJ (TadC family)
MDWIKVFSAILIVGWIVFLWPRAKYWFKNSPKAQEGDWMSAIVPLALIAGFVALLIMMV